MEYRYYRELKHNYLVFKDKGEETKDHYQYRIAESGRIKGLVQCTKRSINGERFYYYEIGSMQTLRDRYQVGGMNCVQLRSLLEDIKELLENLSEFLMGEEGLVFNSRNIYTDLTTGECKMIFCPFFDEPKSFSEFAIELLELVDEKDEKATAMVYRLCDQSAGKEEFIYEVLEYALMNEEEENDGNSSFPVQDSVNDYGDLEYEENDRYMDVGEVACDKEDKGSRLKRADKRLGGKLQLLFSLMFALVVGAMVYIRTHFILNSQENMLSVVVMLVSAVTGVVSMVGGFRAMKGDAAPKIAEKEDRKRESDYEEEESMDYEDFRYEEQPKKSITGMNRNTAKITESINRSLPDTGCPETMVLDQERSGELALFSRNLDKTVRIALDALPVTIGKMEGCVDKVLKDNSISRIHCRITREGERIAVLDLGSTNGTYRNGVRLSPQEKTYIEEGDEIRIGRVCFDCR